MPIWDVAIRILVAAVLAGVIGLEREIREHTAGFRTHILVGVGSAAFTLASYYVVPGTTSDSVVVKSPFFIFPRINAWFFTLLSCFFLIVVFSSRLNNDFDLGYHLKGGQWIIQNHAFPSLDTYTYTVSDHEYLDSHWLFQVSLYLIYGLGGYSLLSIVNIILIIFVFFVTFFRLQLTRVPLWICTVLLGTTVLASEIRFLTRPEILSWAFMSLTLLILELRVQRERDFLLSAWTK